tara:strand:+ start:2358 stop:2714 length:357 start_codon:yes stop_codon:yes gene_type:complete
MRVQVYWNLTKDCWSVVALEGEHKNRVVDHVDQVYLEAATFAVQPAGNARVRAEGRKNVHAFVRGNRVGALPDERRSCRHVMYNPYKYESFVFVDDKAPIESAKTVSLLGRYAVLAEV